MATRKIAILTSGGDAPGMNAAIRAAVRTGIAKGWEMFGVRNGYAGLVDGQIEPLGARDVGGILQRGGTFLGSARLPEFKDEAVRARGLANLQARGIDGLVVIGGNGSQAGALALSQMGLAVVGVASTIDNDLAGSEITIGVDTALNIALEAIDRLQGDRVVAQARLPGRGDGPQLRLPGADGRHRGRRRVGGDPGGRGRARGASRADLQSAYERGKAHALVVVAEGARNNAAAWRSTSRRTRAGWASTCA